MAQGEGGMNHGYEYDVNILPNQRVLREVTYVEPGGIRSMILSQVIDLTDRLTRGALIDLGWSPPAPPAPPAPPMPPRKCIAKGCANHSHQGRFVDDLCLPCHTMIVSGEVRRGTTFIHDLHARLTTIKDALNQFARSIP